MEPEKIKIKPRHQAFVEEYLQNGQNATAAYQKLFKVTEKTAAVQGSKLIRKDNVIAYIKQKQQELADKVLITKQDIIQDLINLKQQCINEGTPRAIQNALKTIEIINKMLGYNAPEQIVSQITNVEQPLFLPIDAIEVEHEDITNKKELLD